MAVRASREKMYLDSYRHTVVSQNYITQEAARRVSARALGQSRPKKRPFPVGRADRGRTSCSSDKRHLPVPSRPFLAVGSGAMGSMVFLGRHREGATRERPLGPLRRTLQP